MNTIVEQIVDRHGWGGLGGWRVGMEGGVEGEVEGRVEGRWMVGGGGGSCWGWGQKVEVRVQAEGGDRGWGQRVEGEGWMGGVEGAGGGWVVLSSVVSRK